MEQCDLDVIQQIYYKVVEASPDAKIVVNDAGVIVVFNTQAELMFGYDRSEVLGKKIEILIPEGRRSAHTKHRDDYFEDPHTREMGIGMDLLGLHRSGKSFKVQIKLAPLIVPNAGVHTLAVVRRVRDAELNPDSIHVMEAKEVIKAIGSVELKSVEVSNVSSVRTIVK